MLDIDGGQRIPYYVIKMTFDIMSDKSQQQYTAYGTLERIPDKEHFWIDSHLKYQPARRLRDNQPVTAILSPEDHDKIGKDYLYRERRYTELRDLDLEGYLNDTVYKSKEVKGVVYQCEDKVFYYEKPGDRLDYPKICPLGHPAYEDF